MLPNSRYRYSRLNPPSWSSLRYSSTSYEPTKCVRICNVRCCPDNCNAPNVTTSFNLTFTPCFRRHVDLPTCLASGSHPRPSTKFYCYIKLLWKTNKKPSINLLTKHNTICHQKPARQSTKRQSKSQTTHKGTAKN